jgi:mycofactocin precursor
VPGMENESTLDDDTTADSTDAASDAPEVADELLIEEISIDGMCGVY